MRLLRRQGLGAAIVWCVACASLGGLALGCDDKPPKKMERLTPPPPEDDPLPLPKPKSAPTFRIDDLGPLVGFSRSMLVTPDGQDSATGRAQLASDLAAEKEYITDKVVVIQVDRKAQPEWVALYLKEVFALSPKSVLIETESRPEYPKSIEFVSRSAQTQADPCTIVGTVTEQRATAIWRVSGGTARKRPRGMSGPDLTRTADTIQTMFKGCKSDLFIVHAAPGVEWGMIYDLAAAGLAVPDSPLKRAGLPETRPTPGQAVTL